MSRPPESPPTGTGRMGSRRSAICSVSRAMFCCNSASLEGSWSRVWSSLSSILLLCQLVLQAVVLGSVRGQGAADRERLADAAEDAALLEDDEDRHEGPVPQQPVDPQPRAGDAVEGLQRGLAPGDRVPGELDLRGDLDDASDDDQPQQPEARLGAGFGREDQLARADDGAGDDHARPEPAQRAEQVRGGDWIPAGCAGPVPALPVRARHAPSDRG